MPTYVLPIILSLYVLWMHYKNQKTLHLLSSRRNTKACIIYCKLLQILTLQSNNWLEPRTAICLSLSRMLAVRISYPLRNLDGDHFNKTVWSSKEMLEFPKFKLYWQRININIFGWEWSKRIILLSYVEGVRGGHLGQWASLGPQRSPCGQRLWEHLIM